MSRARSTASRRADCTATSLSSSWINGTKAYLIDSNPKLDKYKSRSLADLIDAGARERVYGPMVCIIENVLPEDYKLLESKWRLDPSFFQHYRSGRGRDREWGPPWPVPRMYSGSQYVSDRSRDYAGYPGTDKDWQTEDVSPGTWDHIDGVFEYPGIDMTETELKSDRQRVSASKHIARNCYHSPWSDMVSLCSDTRISYYRVDDSLYLFLVDAPLYLQNRYRDLPRYIRPTLRLPYAKNWGGILLPQILSKENEKENDGSARCLSVADLLIHVFRFRWQRELLFNHKGNATSQAFPSPLLCYVISNSLWRSNLEYLTKEIKRISFREIRNPRPEINKKLHDLREDLVDFMITGLIETQAYIPGSIRQFWKKQARHPTFGKITQDGTGATPLDNLATTLERAEKLETFIMHSFQTLMSSVSIRDTRKVTLLTIFATMFLPLSLVATGFGMNLKELNAGSVLSFWEFLVAATVTFTITVIALLVLHLTLNMEWRPAK